LAITWICGGTALWSYTGTQVALTPKPGTSGLSQAQSKQADQIANSLTLGIGSSVFLCTGLPTAILFGVLTLLCYFAWQSERRQEELIAVERSRNDLLATMAMNQIGQNQRQNKS
jgi:hypothetical protein